MLKYFVGIGKSHIFAACVFHGIRLRLMKKEKHCREDNASLAFRFQPFGISESRVWDFRIARFGNFCRAF